MRAVRLQDDEGSVGARVHRGHQKIDRAGRIAARRQHQVAAKPAVTSIQIGKPVGNCLAGNVRHAFGHDIAKLAFGMDIDHADGRLVCQGGHSVAAARRPLIVIRGEMASVAVTISTMAPDGAAQARSHAAVNSSVRVTRSP